MFKKFLLAALNVVIMLVVSACVQPQASTLSSSPTSTTKPIPTQTQSPSLTPTEETVQSSVVLCSTNETPLFGEDFVSGQNQNFELISDFNNDGPVGWNVQEDPEDPNNYALFGIPSQVSGINPPMLDAYGNHSEKIGDAVIRFRMMASPDIQIYINLHTQNDQFEINGTSYASGYYAFSFINFAAGGGGENSFLDRSLRTLDDNWEVSDLVYWTWPHDEKWHLVELSMFQGELKVWNDGSMLASITDDAPIPEGYFSFRANLNEEDTGSKEFVAFDDISICGLNAPFETIYSAN